MKKWLPIIIILGIILLIGAYMASLNNKLVVLDQNATAQWANVESSYQRRADLIPNIVSTAKGYAEFEQSTLIAVTEARSKATSVILTLQTLLRSNLHSIKKHKQALPLPFRVCWQFLKDTQI